MAAMNPILRLRRAFRSMGADAQQADDAAGAVDDYSYSRRESDLRHAQMMAENRHYMAEIRNQIVLAIMLAAGLIIGAVGLLVALVD